MKSSRDEGGQSGQSDQTQCIFCEIGAGRAKADVVYDGGDTLFFRDRAPKARVHVIGIPKEHVVSLAAVSRGHQTLLGKLMIDIADVAQKQGVAESGYRVITNAGTHAGQEVPHMHWHILGGEPLGPLVC